MTFRIPRRLGALCVGALLAASLAHAGEAGDQAFRAARDAYAGGDAAAVARQLPALRGHTLAPYAEYWDLQLRLEEASQAEVDAFLERESGSLLAERLRGEWLKRLGRAEAWQAFERGYARLAAGDLELGCYDLQARLVRQDATALREAKRLWLDTQLPASCAPVLQRLAETAQVDEDDIWRRLRRLVESGRLGAARATAALLPDAVAPDAKALERVVESPAAYRHKLRPNFAATRAGRELAMMAIARMARSDAQVAAQSFEGIKARLSAAERAYVYGQLGWQAAASHLPQANDWYKAAGATPMTDEQLAWNARAALRTQDWALLREVVENLPPQLSTQPEWIYWRGRALAALGEGEPARLVYRAIAGRPHFYGILAAEELGQPLALPARASRASVEEMEQVAKQPAIARALALFRFDLRPDAVKEWNWALRGQGDRFLLAAAELASRQGIFDRAISAADRTEAEHDYALRYLAPYRETVEPRARALALDPTWVYGLMRQESRFVTDVRSSAGARGLMQLMPATARWMARRLGLKDYTHAGIQDIDTNVALGTGYLKVVLDSLDGHPVLASAAYNAGPGRARRWRGARPLEGAIYAETIPFTETRDYVKKVMANAVFYAAVFDGRAPSLKERLGLVHPAGQTDAAEAAIP